MTTTWSVLASAQLFVTAAVALLLGLTLRQLRSMQRDARDRFDAATAEIDHSYDLLRTIEAPDPPSRPRAG